MLTDWRTTLIGIAAMLLAAVAVYQNPELINSDGVKLLIGSVFGTGAALLWARDRAIANQPPRTSKGSKVRK